MKYRNRKGEEIEEKGRGEQLWRTLYGTAIGRILLKPFTSPAFSKFAGTLLDSRLSSVLILPFIWFSHVNMEEYEPKFYESYNAFFGRSIKKEFRPVDRELGSLLAPCDGKLMLYAIEEDLTMAIKNSRYSLPGLLKSRALADKYAGGTAMVIRLTMEDYHHFCYVADGQKGPNHYLDGKLHVCVPVSWLPEPVYKENAREYCRIRTKYFGEVIQMEIGATMIGRIANKEPGRAMVEKGAEKGHFEFGGSTVVVLLQKDQAEFEEDLVANSASGIETQVRMGERIGYRSQQDKSLRYFTMNGQQTEKK